MMVRPDARGAGIGQALLDACLALARQADGIELMTLSVTAGNRVAERLYERAGFTIHGTLKRAIRLGDTVLDKNLMSLCL